MTGTTRASRLSVWLAVSCIASLVAGCVEAQDQTGQDYLTRPPSDEIIYFVLPDRFENADKSNDTGHMKGGRLEHGFDPTHKGFYHGGDIEGLTSRLDYIQSLGATAIWLGPIYKNKPVQGGPGYESAGYHGYWITDFMAVDPHFGGNDALKTFVDAAHARDMKVYLDIITNHTADVIAYKECHDPSYDGADKVIKGCPYRSKAEWPYTTRGDTSGEAINAGFMGDQTAFQTTENFTRLTRSDYAYTPMVPESEKNIKNPTWLNDPIFYHNRGDTHWYGESNTYGDFAGLDDLLTEHPQVVNGMIDIYKHWVSTYHVDGFRIDTAKHVNPEFWHKFNVALLDHAKSEGIPNFYIFGEAYHETAAPLARHTRVGGFDYVLDFGFQKTVAKVIAEGAPSKALKDFFEVDDLYGGGEKAARNLPVFIGNHDMGRFATLVQKANPNLNADAILKRVTVAHAMMYFLRGAPVIYYGDEQGFMGDGHDQDAREDMFPSRVASYNDNILLGSTATTAQSNFDRSHPLYLALRSAGEIYKGHAALRRGRQITRLSEHDGGLFAVSRLDENGGEYLIVFNLSDDDRSAFITTDPRSTQFDTIVGACPSTSAATASVKVSLPAWGYSICRSNPWSADQ